MRRLRRLARTAAIGAIAVAAGPTAAQAVTWSEIPSGTTSEISAVEYQGGTRFWFTTKSGEIFTRNADGSFFRTFGPSSVPLNDIEFLPGSGLGFAVGNAGQVLRSTNGGATWENVNPAGTPIPVSKKAASSTFNDCTATEPLGDVNAVRFAGSGRVWIFAEGSQIARSSDADLGGAGKWVDANRDTKGTADPADDTCKVAITYNQGGGDAFFPPANPDVGYICTAFFGEVFFTADNLATAATKKPADCGNGTLFNRRLAGDPDNANRMWAVGPGDGNASYMRMTADGWTSSNPLTLTQPDKRPLGKPYDVDYAGGTVLVAGDAGMLLTSTDGVNFSFADATGALATENWRAGSLAGASAAAVGGVGGRLAVSGDANVPPDITPPTGTIAGPDSGKAGQPLTFTAQVADEAGGSGINAAGLTWTAPGLTNQTGPSATFTFPNAGFYTVTLSFADNAGNGATATKSVSIAAASGGGSGAGSKPKPVLPGKRKPPVAGKAARKQGKYVVMKVRGRLGVPAGVSRSAACRGTMSLSVYKGKKRIGSKKTKVKPSCKYAKTVRVKRRKVGKASRIKLKVAFKGNAVLAPLSSTYSVKVKKAKRAGKH